MRELWRSARPADEILLGEHEQFRLLPQSPSGTAAQLKADFIQQLVTHIASLDGRFAEVNATSERCSADAQQLCLGLPGH